MIIVDGIAFNDPFKASLYKQGLLDKNLDELPYGLQKEIMLHNSRIPESIIQKCTCYLDNTEKWVKKVNMYMDWRANANDYCEWRFRHKHKLEEQLEIYECIYKE